MKLGTMEIGNPVKGEIKVESDPERAKVIMDLEGTPLKNEQEFLRQLKLAEFFSTWPVREIDVGFLSMGKPYKHKAITRVPVFGVFRYHFGTSSFEPCEGSISTLGFIDVHRVFAQQLRKALKSKVLENKTTIEPLGLDFSGYSAYLARIANIGDSVPYRIIAKFAGVLPNKTKDILKEAAECFDEVAIIAEADWEVTTVRLEPFLVGVVKDRVFLLDHFDTSDLEKYVLAEFLT